ncbi:GNAT family N-acetyltransferase [Aliiglaciecola sp. CAU 1673]|uniref:GNAT family N-acetyltransferase n=1 Tax=Aliiglaciecola sp. CAU 1673 TaxID=3032595 RepID=UPI0023D9E185|nr:GNAT family N-acetyltransferase [Aliiglaciecola sp. CAU 1673]MDF2178722.1 GNAT family N-acetyltransferase [Aliiglaciecola sp. CAU 1673]
MSDYSKPQSLHTERLRLRQVTFDDAPFILSLVNDPDWLRYIGDKGVSDMESARGYIEKGPMQQYQQHGHGLMLVELASTQEPLGLCGILKRDTLPQPDLGFAFAAHARGKGYALEAANAVLRVAKADNHQEVLAICLPENHRSIGLLEHCGFAFRSTYQAKAEDPVLSLYAWCAEQK